MRKLGILLLVGLACTTAFAQTKVRVGYLHTMAVDGAMWTAIDNGIYKKYGLEIQPVQFNSGIPLSQALSGGSVDVAVMGAVISNFPSRGVGKIFLLNDIEFGTAMIFVQGNSGITSVADLAGKKVATTRGTTAHVLLATALQKNGLSPNAADVVNMDMAAAVSAFIAGAVPAVATWWPFDTQIKKQDPTAKLLTTAGDYYPEAAIMDGWVANTRYYQNHRDVLVKLDRAWLEANTMMLDNTDATLRSLQKNHYPNLTAEDLLSGWKLLRTFSNSEWLTRYQDGTAAGWIGQVEHVFVNIGALQNYVDPSQFFDASIYEQAYKENQSQ